MQTEGGGVVGAGVCCPAGDGGGDGAGDGAVQTEGGGVVSAGVCYPAGDDDDSEGAGAVVSGTDRLEIGC